MPGGSSRIKCNDEVYGSRSSTRSSNGRETDFMKYISIDLSSFESRFEQIFDKLDELETRIALVPPGERALSEATKNVALNGDTRNTHFMASEIADANPATVTGSEADEAAAVALRPGSLGGADLSDLAKEIESLRAAQLRLQINQEVAHSTLRVDVETLRRDLDLMPQYRDLQNFRAELDVALANTVQTMQTEQAHVAQNLNVTLSERELAENKWKSVFEDTIAARIQDLWSGMHSATRKLNESIQFMQTDLVKQEENAKDVSDTMELLRKTTSTLERDTRAHETTLGDHDKGIEQAFTLLAQTDAKLAAQEEATAGHVTVLTARIEQIESRLNTTQQRHDAFAHEIDTTLENVCSDVVSCQSTLQAHQESLHAFDTGMLGQGAELTRVNDALLRQDAKLGGLDGRVAMSEKKTATLASVLQEQHHEMQQHVHTLTTALNYATSDRAAMKRVATDMSFSLQETQQRVSEVAKLATTTDLGLMRTASEIPKLHALVASASANVAKNRQMLHDLTVMLDEERATVQSLQTQLDAEVALSATRFTDVAIRDDATQQAILDANATTQHIRHSLEDAIRYNGNLIHQLNTMVDSIAITESADGMEDKLAKFALSVAELGLKMEHFVGGNTSNSSNHGGGNGVADVKTELAVLLTKVIRFLGSGVAIDQNKYLFTFKRTQSVAEDGSGAIVVEAPPQHVLEGFRVAKAALFCNKARMYMDQLEPVLGTNKHTIAFRDHFERKLKWLQKNTG
uniref:Uncharacterized protein n=1 Tax=Globisporangium ultimum (strain ATCC 200006 / CBS 805.95 / DAOM BR144) TaxID=431595 RepID=K3X9F3_GLOUD